jgi:acyl-coenzyme A thioesterase 13
MLPYGVEEAIDGDDAGPSGGSGAGAGGGGNGNGRDAPLDPLERASEFLAAVANDPGRFDGRALPALTAVSCTVVDGDSSCSLRCEIPFTRALTNRYGGLHGGCAATLVDVVSTAALAALTDRAGVSLSITAHYHRPVVPLGGGGGDTSTIIVVDADVVKVGKNVAAVDVAIRSRAAGKSGSKSGGKGNDGPVLVSGTHVKALVARSDVGALFEHAAAEKQRRAGGRVRSRL